MRVCLALAASVLVLGACDQIGLAPATPDATSPQAQQEEQTSVAKRVAAPVLTAGGASGAPLARPAAARPEAYDQSTAEEKAAATAPAPTTARKLGDTIASLGNPTEQGFWIKTPLAKTAGKGRLVDPVSGKSVNVDLIPRPGAEAGGSQVSLAALQMLGVSLTGLPRLEVYSR